MLAIVNVTGGDIPTTGLCQYEVRINSRVIATFEHQREYDGAAQCLRDAADAIERCSLEEKMLMLDILNLRMDEAISAPRYTMPKGLSREEIKQHLLDTEGENTIKLTHKGANDVLSAMENPPHANDRLLEAALRFSKFKY